MAKLNIPSMKKKGSQNPTGSHGPDKVVVTQLPQIRDFTHTHTIHNITENTAASEFARAEGKSDPENY